MCTVLAQWAQHGGLMLALLTARRRGKRAAANVVCMLCWLCLSPALLSLAQLTLVVTCLAGTTGAVLLTMVE